VNKKKAKDHAWNNTKSWADIKELIDSCRNETNPIRQSRVNPAMTVEQCLDIFDAAIKTRLRMPNETPSGHRYDIYKRREVMSGDGLMIQNILRECA
jgi:hypothetical protein